jgi:hypothetical protein
VDGAVAAVNGAVLAAAVVWLVGTEFWLAFLIFDRGIALP